MPLSQIKQHTKAEWYASTKRIKLQLHLTKWPSVFVFEEELRYFPPTFQLHSAGTRTIFITCLVLIPEYSAYLKLELYKLFYRVFLGPVVTVLQSQKLDFLVCTKHVQKSFSWTKSIEKMLTKSKNFLIILSRLLKKTELNSAKVNSQKHRSNILHRIKFNFGRDHY